MAGNCMKPAPQWAMRAESALNLRIASLVPSLTELLLALGLKPWVVARTGYCVHPVDQVADIPKVGGTKTVNLQKLRRLAPSHVLVNVDENTLPTVQALREFVPHVLVTHPCSPQDNLTLFDQIVADLPAAGPWQATLQEQAALWKQRIAHELALTRPETFAAQRVLYLIWREPWMTVARDTYLSRMLAQVNWQTWPDVRGGQHGAARYPLLAGDEPWLADVQQVLLSSEPYAFGPGHVPQAQALCPQAAVRLVDGQALSWYGPRTVHGLQMLRAWAEQNSAGAAAQ